MSEDPFKYLGTQQNDDPFKYPGTQQTAFQHVPQDGKLGPVLFGFLVLITVFFTYQFIGGFFEWLLIGVEVTTKNVQSVRILMIFSQIVFLLLPAVALLYFQGWKIRQALRLRIPTMREILLVIVSVIALQLVLQTFLTAQNYIWTEYLIPKSLQPLFDKFQHLIDGMYENLLLMRSPAEFVFVLFVAGLMPAVCEEVLFRGVVQHSFERGMKKRWAFLLTSAMFSLFHMNPMNLLVILFLGLYLSYIVWRSGSLYLSMIAHFTNNAFSVWLMYAYKKDDIILAQGSEPATTVLLEATAGCVLLAAVCIWYFRRISVQRENQTNTL